MGAEARQRKGERIRLWSVSEREAFIAVPASSEVKCRVMEEESASVESGLARQSLATVEPDPKPEVDRKPPEPGTEGSDGEEKAEETSGEVIDPEDRLSQLLPEIRRTLMSYLDLKSLVKMQQVSRRFHRLASDPRLFTRIKRIKLGGCFMWQRSTIKTDAPVLDVESALRPSAKKADGSKKP